MSITVSDTSTKEGVRLATSLISFTVTAVSVSSTPTPPPSFLLIFQAFSSIPWPAAAWPLDLPFRPITGPIPCPYAAGHFPRDSRPSILLYEIFDMPQQVAWFDTYGVIGRSGKGVWQIMTVPVAKSIVTIWQGEYGRCLPTSPDLKYPATANLSLARCCNSKITLWPGPPTVARRHEKLFQVWKFCFRDFNGLGSMDKPAISVLPTL